MVRDEVLQAFANLDNDRDFAAFMDEVVRRRDAARDSMEKATDLLSVGRHQGASMLASDIIALSQGAREAVAKRRAAAGR